AGGVCKSRSMVGSHHHATSFSPSAAFASFAAAPIVSTSVTSPVFERTHASPASGRSRKARFEGDSLAVRSSGSFGCSHVLDDFVTSSLTHGFACQCPEPAPRVLWPPIGK